MISNLTKRLEKIKQAYSIYINHNFNKIESLLIIKNILKNCILIIDEGIKTDDKHFFRQNKELLIITKFLLMQKPRFTRLEEEKVRETIINYKKYSIIKVQSMKF